MNVQFVTVGRPEWLYIPPPTEEAEFAVNVQALAISGVLWTSTDADVGSPGADGLTDGDEVTVHGSDPLDTDSDADGLPDGDEVNVYGTDPTSTDTEALALPAVTVKPSRTAVASLRPVTT